MTSSAFFTRFRRQLRFWAFHCVLNALPSFCIAFFYLEFWKVPEAVSAMVLGIGTFILIYSCLTSMYGPRADENHVLARSLRLGTRIRGWISGLSVLLMWIPGVFFTPDFWCGWAASIFVNLIQSPVTRVNKRVVGIMDHDFTSVYLTTLIEGLILSFLLLLISFFAVIVLQARERRKFLESADLSGESSR